MQESAVPIGARGHRQVEYTSDHFQGCFDRRIVVIERYRHESDASPIGIGVSRCTEHLCHFRNTAIRRREIQCQLVKQCAEIAF